MAQAFTSKRDYSEAFKRFEFLDLHRVAKLPLVRAGGISGAFDQGVREDFTHASLERARSSCAWPTLDFALMGGEPFANWV